MGRLSGKVAIISGGAGGIGSATATLFAKEGAQVLLVDLKEAALQQVVEAIGSDSVSYVTADVTDPEQVQHYVQTALERYGGVDIFFNNAGIVGELERTTEYSIEMFDRVMAINVRGVWLGLKYVMPAMQKRGGGSIVMTSSVAGLSGAPRMSAYVASKHAVVGLMKTAALEGAKMGIRINTINPGPIDTQMVQIIEDLSSPERNVAQQRILQSIPFQRYGTPEEVAQLVLFLASPQSQFCTGGTYTVDGGMMAGR